MVTIPDPRSIGTANRQAEHFANQHGFYLESDSAYQRIDACPGSVGCRSGHFDAQALAHRIAEAGFRAPLHISGCAKGCAHPRATDFAIWGSADGLHFAKNAMPGAFPLLSGMSEAQIYDIIATETVSKKNSTRERQQ